MEFGYTTKYLTRDGEPWFPLMGEIHYSRLPRNEWRESLAKMRAGGIDIASSYVIWIHHEEAEGEVDFTGNRDLRAFVEEVGRAGMLMWLRIGPWVHAEVRNGGFPDWLLSQDFQPRTNDERYFAQVERFYRLVSAQVAGLFHSQGGPIIGIQIENEYGHCGGLTGEAGDVHIRRLAGIAGSVGFEVPYWTATGWGGAMTGGLLPVMGGYADSPWDPRLTAIEPSGNFVITPERNDHNIGSDLGLGAGLTFDPTRFPYLTAELGGGLQVTRRRRPVAHAADVAAMSMAKLGSGVNLLGYYMYHGGINPDGRLSTLQESTATGYPNDLPVKSYDFRAPLGAYGQLSDSWQELRLLSMFLRDFGSELCRMLPEFPPDNPLEPDDATRLRHSVRHNGEWGFVFFNNYNRVAGRPSFTDVRVRALGRELPPFEVPADAYGCYPFNMPVQGGTVRFARATPLCRMGMTTVFYGDDIDATPGADVLLISRDDALRAYLLDGRLVLSDDPIIDGRCLVSRPDSELAVTARHDGAGRVVLGISGYDPSAHDYGLRLSYRGDSIRILIGGRLADDDFWADGTHYLGLRRHGFPDEIVVECAALRQDAPVFLERWPFLDADSACAVDGVTVTRTDWIPLDLGSWQAGEVPSVAAPPFGTWPTPLESPVEPCRESSTVGIG
ncbi:MAG: beta-galactosidase [Propionibacteriaceae bacterium]|jgi:hypothetical protein|nr:beta-galactosidase [Propionibacteriaceae bacterium]